MRLNEFLLEGKAEPPKEEPPKPGVAPAPGPPMKISPKAKSLKIKVDPVDVDQDQFKKDGGYRSKVLKAIGRQLKRAVKGLGNTVSDVANEELSDIAVIVFDNVMEGKDVPKQEVAKTTSKAVMEHFINMFLQKIKIPRPIASWLSKMLTKLLATTFQVLIEKWVAKHPAKQLNLPGISASAKQDAKETILTELEEMVDDGIDKTIKLLSKGTLPTTTASAIALIKADLEKPMKLSAFLKQAVTEDAFLKRALEVYEQSGGKNKKILVAYLKRAVQGEDLFHLHPGPTTLYRGHTGKGSAPKGVSSWTRSRAMAEMFGDNILKITISQDTPAIDVSKVPGVKKSFDSEQEIIVLL